MYTLLTSFSCSRWLFEVMYFDLPFALLSYSAWAPLLVNGSGSKHLCLLGTYPTLLAPLASFQAIGVGMTLNSLVVVRRKKPLL